jgi:hypothetical protein
MAKKLNIEQTQSELRGGSAFFPGYKGGDSPTPTSETPQMNSTEDTAINPTPSVKEADKTLGIPPSVPRTVPRTTPLIPRVKRPIRQRQSFDIYEDQYRTLKKIADTEKDFVNGRGMSQMVREAIDQYLKDHSRSNK